MIRNPMRAIGLAAAVAFAATAVQAQTQMKAPSSADKAFMTKAIQGDLAEIQMGKLAQQNGQSQKVKQFGETLVQDHSANLDKAKTLAQSISVTVPGVPSASDKATYDRMSKLSGKSFDERFAKDMVADHKKDIAAFNKEAKKSGDVADFAKDTLPTLHKHLNIAELISRGETTGSK